MKKDIKVIALDLDGTLFDNNKKITGHTKEVLSECASRGIIVLPATGRPATGFPYVLETLPFVEYALTSNGAMVYNYTEKKAVYKDLLSAEHTLKILDYARDFDVMADVYVNCWGYSQKSFLDNVEHYVILESMVQYVRSTRKVVENMREFIEKNGTPCEKVVFTFRDLSLQKRFMEESTRFPFARVTTALVNNVEYNNRTANKGDSLIKFGKLLDIPREKIMACGDGLNDLDMLKASGFSVAMGNAAPELKEIADYITSVNEEDGVAAAIEKFVL